MQRAAGFTLVGMFTECMSQAGIHMCVTADNVGVQTAANLKLGTGTCATVSFFAPGAYLFSCCSLLSLIAALFISPLRQ